MSTSSLQLRSIHRPGGAGQHERFTYDFVVDGLSLADALEVRKLDLVGRLDVIHNKWNAHVVKTLLLTGPPDVSPDRVMLYVCPECADLGCGAFTARVSHDGDEFHWDEFRYENNYDPEMTRNRPDIGPFRFTAENYQSVLNGFRADD